MENQTIEEIISTADSLPAEYWKSLADAMNTISKSSGVSDESRARNLGTLTRCFEHPFNRMPVVRES